MVHPEERSFNKYSAWTDDRLTRFLRHLHTDVLVTTRAGLNLAAARLAPHAVRTPLIENPVLGALTGRRVFLKLENLQRTGSFKFRGAYNRMALIPPDESGTDRPFPRMRADHFGALLVLDRLLGRATVDAHDLLAAATDVAGRHPKAMTAAFRDDPAQLADATAVILAELDLLRADGEAWRVMPAAARFRNPKVVLTQQRIEGEE